MTEPLKRQSGRWDGAQICRSGFTRHSDLWTADSGCGSRSALSLWAYSCFSASSRPPGFGMSGDRWVADEQSATATVSTHNRRSGDRGSGNLCAVQSYVRRFRPPKAIVVLGIGVVYGSVDVAAPIVLSMVGPRHGWHGRSPGPINLIGVVIVVLGAVIVVRALADHVRAIRERHWDVVKIDPNHLLTPEYLVVDGVYGCSRNPLYVGDITMWVGWAAFLGSLPVGIGAIVLAAGLSIGVRLEERGLERQFGEEWSAYAREVPRFVGKRGPELPIRRCVGPRRSRSG